MFNRLSYLGILISIVVGVILFHVKYEVVALAGALDKVQNEILSTEESIHLLQAEWAYLNEPSRIQKLATEHLHMAATQTNQVVRDDRVVQCLYDLGQSKKERDEQLILTSGEQ